MIVTHHAPTLNDTSEHKFEGPFFNPVMFGFSSNLEYLFKNYGRDNNSNVDTWLFGHTHFSNQIVKYGTKIISNQRGYNFEVDKNYKVIPSLIRDYFGTIFYYLI